MTPRRHENGICGELFFITEKVETLCHADLLLHRAARAPCSRHNARVKREKKQEMSRLACASFEVPVKSVLLAHGMCPDQDTADIHELPAPREGNQASRRDKIDFSISHIVFFCSFRLLFICTVIL